jgi:hypothetical protein
MVVLAPGGPPMSRRVYLRHPDMPKGDFRYWPRPCETSGKRVATAAFDPLRTFVGGLLRREMFSEFLRRRSLCMRREVSVHRPL